MLIQMLCLALFPGCCSFCQQDGWLVLFDGSSTEEWVAAGADSFPSRGWTIDEEEGSLICQGGGNLMTRRTFSDFELRLEFRINPRGNSGIFYRYNGETRDAPEYQILDDYEHPDAKRGRSGNRTVASLYDVFPPGDKKLLKAGNWNTARIIAAGNRVEHWLNGEKVLEYEIGSQEFEAAVAESKFSGRPHFARQPSGHILLQDHRDVVSFRTIKIRPLNQTTGEKQK